MTNLHLNYTLSTTILISSLFCTRSIDREMYIRPIYLVHYSEHMDLTFILHALSTVIFGSKSIQNSIVFFFKGIKM